MVSQFSPLERPLGRFLPLTLAETTIINDALRCMELSLLWYGTTDHSFQRLAQFVADEGKEFLSKAVFVIRQKLRAKGRIAVSSPGWLWLSYVRGVFYQNTRIWVGKAWVADHTLEKVLQAGEDFLKVTLAGTWAGDRELVLIKQAVSALHAQMCAAVPAGTPWTALRFFGCEYYGRPAA